MLRSIKSTCFTLAVLIAVAHPVRATEAELKFLVSKKDTAGALAKVKAQLQNATALEVDVCFFDTADGELEKAGIIIRAREKKGKKDDSTLKLRAASAAPVQGTLASALPVEHDWTSLNKVNLSRSMDDEDIKKDLFDQVMDGTEPAKKLFKTQEALLQEQKPGFNTDTLKRYGPIKAQVWKYELTLQGFGTKVTVEHWSLGKPGAEEEILELSAKVNGDSEDDVRAQAKAFYDAIAAANYGCSESMSKTQIVMEFFKPGK